MTGPRPEVRARVKGIAAPLVATILAVLLIDPSSGAAARNAGPDGHPRHRHTIRTPVDVLLAPGLEYRQMVERPGPIRIDVLEIDPRLATIGMDVAPASDTYPGYRRTSGIAGARDALAAVNGDFAVAGRPVHVHADDDELRTSGTRGASVFSLQANGSGGTLGSGQRLSAWATPATLGVTAVVAGRDHSVAHWNDGRPTGRQVTAYTAVGGRAQPPPPTCEVRLAPAGPVTTNGGRVLRAFTVDAVAPCSEHRRLSVRASDGDMVLATRDRQSWVTLLERGQPLSIAWSLDRPNTLDAVGGMPQLVAAGRPLHYPLSSSFARRNPRTGIGVNAGCPSGREDCRIFLVTVDGRRPGWSVGMTLTRFARVFTKPAYGIAASWAFNLDGGGSTTMWLGRRRAALCKAGHRYRTRVGCIGNRPSGSSERAVVSAVLVLPAPDTVGSAASADGIARGSSGRSSWHDPGSTGGLFDAIAAGDLGRSALPPGGRRIVRSFRARHGRR